ncbi:MAG: hypothetical protein AABY18_06395 [Candidatus Thermoplasmatota archaeon]
MVRRGAAFGLAVLLVAALVPSAASRPLPPIANDHTVIAVQVPLDALGSGSLQIPVAGGILDLRVVPAPLSGAGGDVDVQAFVAQASLLMPDGVRIPLPNLVIVPEHEPLDGQPAQALAALAAAAGALSQALENATGEAASQAEQLQGNASDQAAAIQDALAALQAEAALVQAYAEEAAGATAQATQDGVDAQVAIALAMVSQLEPALLVIEDGLDSVAAQANAIAPSPAAPDPSGLQTALEAAIANAQAQSEDTSQQATLARQALVGGAKDASDDNDPVEARRHLMGGAKAALALAQDALADNEAGAQQQLAMLITALQGEAAANGQQAQAQAEATTAALSQAAADLEWASAWLAAAQSQPPAVAEAGLASAEASAAAAQATVNDLRAIVNAYSPDAVQPAVEAQEQALTQGEAELAAAAAAIGAAQAEVDATLAQGEQAVGDLAADPESVGEGYALCLDSLDSQICLTYVAPAASAPPSVRLLVALPVGPEVDLDLPGSVTTLTSGLGDLTSSLTGSPTPPPLPLPTGFPGSTSASASPSASSSASSSSSSASASSSASSSSSSTTAQAQPHLVVEAASDALSLRMGEQASLRVSVRNDGDAADTVRLTAQTDAPIAFDSTTEALDLAPGAAGEFVLRITPRAAGSGQLEVLATGDRAGTVKDVVAIDVAAAAAAAAAIVASIEPSALQGSVGQALAVSVALANEASVADLVSLTVSGAGFSAEPARFDVLLQPDERVVREVRITPSQAGALQVVLAITSEHGADLKPLVAFDAHDGAAPADGSLGAGDKPAKDTPGLGALAVAAAVVLTFLGVRRRLEK